MTQKVMGYVLVIAKDIAKSRGPIGPRIKPYKHWLTHIAWQPRTIGDIILHAGILHPADEAQGKVAHIL